MIKKIALICTLVSLLIALPLAFMGIKYIKPGAPFLAFINGVVADLETWKFEIPDIPKIPYIDNPNFFEGILNALYFIINVITRIGNFAIALSNVFIYVIQFIVALIKHIINLVKNFNNYTDHPTGWIYPI